MLGPLNRQGIFHGQYRQKGRQAGHLYGVFRETAAMSLLTGSEAETITDSSLKSVARASQLYTAAGITTADQGGTDPLDFAQPNYGPLHYGYALGELQSALAENVLSPRIIAHPFGVYFSRS
ncbi:MAG: hypothetical protein V8Q84_07245 [Bilophila sp.]